MAPFSIRQSRMACHRAFMCTFSDREKLTAGKLALTFPFHGTRDDTKIHV